MIFEPLALRDQETTWQRNAPRAMRWTTMRWRSADFAGAVEAFATFAREDPPAARFYERAQHHLQSGHAHNWTPVTLASK